MFLERSLYLKTTEKTIILKKIFIYNSGATKVLTLVHYFHKRGIFAEHLETPSPTSTTLVRQRDQWPENGG